MEFQRLEVKTRKGTGKGTSRKLRADGRIPGVVYGRGIDSVAIDLAPRDLRGALLGPRRRNTVLNMVLKADGGADRELLVMLQDHQIHPRSRRILHADFLLVDLERDVDVYVPLITTGKCNGVQMGGIPDQFPRRGKGGKGIVGEIDRYDDCFSGQPGHGLFLQSSS